MSRSVVMRKLSEVDHFVIGGGVVGLAVGAQLAARGSTLVVDMSPTLANSTSARNSGVRGCLCPLLPPALRTSDVISPRPVHHPCTPSPDPLSTSSPF